MKIALASDHAGFELKKGIAAHLAGRGYALVDFGCDSDAPVDYVVYGARAAASVAAGECDRAILFCGTGLGMAVVANKFRGVRATPCWSVETASISRRHNDSNCLTLGGRVLALDTAVAIAATWLDAPFEGGRHERRVREISDLERANFK